MSHALLQELPAEESAAGRVARRLARLQGPSIQAPDGTANAAELLAIGDAFAATQERLDQARDEAFVDSAEELLLEWEIALGLPATASGTTADRRATLLALSSSSRGGTPQDLLALARSLVSGATLREYTATEAAALGSQRYVFTLRFALGASYGDTELEARLRELLRPAAPAHVQIEFASTLYDALTTESSEELLTETGEELTTET